MEKKIYEGPEKGIYGVEDFCMMMEVRGAETVHRDIVPAGTYGRTRVIWHLNGATVHYEKGLGILNGEDVPNLVTVKVHGLPDAVSGIEAIVRGREK